MNDVTWVPKEELLAVAKRRFDGTDVLLDIGCGIMPQSFIAPSVHVCVEPFHEYVEVLQRKAVEATDRSYVILQNTWGEALKILPPKSVDTVVLADVIEHLEKDVALRLLKETEALARQQILIFTPLGFLPQVHPDGIDAWGLSGGDWQEHKSGWLPEDFGDGWEFVGSKEYYFQDNLGRPFREPFGAFWAIRKLGSASDQKRIGRRVLSNRFSAVAGRLNFSAPVGFALATLELLASLRNVASRLYRPLGRALRRDRPS